MTEDVSEWAGEIVDDLETVVDFGGYCDWCSDPLEPGQVVLRRGSRRIHEDECAAAAHAENSFDEAAMGGGR